MAIIPLRSPALAGGLTNIHCRSLSLEVFWRSSVAASTKLLRWYFVGLRSTSVGSDSVSLSDRRTTKDQVPLVKIEVWVGVYRGCSSEANSNQCSTGGSSSFPLLTSP